MMTMTWIVSINMVIAQFELHNKKHLELVFFLAVGYIAFLTPSNQLLLKGRMSGVIIYRYALLLAIISVTLATFCTLSSVFMGEFHEVLLLLFSWSLLLFSRLQMNTSFSQHMFILPDKTRCAGKRKRVCLNSFRHRPLVFRPQLLRPALQDQIAHQRQQQGNKIVKHTVREQGGD